jgi:hypothetical protein
MGGVRDGQLSGSELATAVDPSRTSPGAPGEERSLATRREVVHPEYRPYKLAEAHVTPMRGDNERIAWTARRVACSSHWR